MSDLIRIVDLEIWSTIGVPDEERSLPQRLLVSAEMRVTDFSKPAVEDNISLTVNYAEVAEYIRNFASERPRKLLETFAEQLADGLLNAFAIKRVRLEIKKFVIPYARHVAVEVERKAKKSKSRLSEI
jgi:dihydroneopterin aldolase